MSHRSAAVKDARHPTSQQPEPLPSLPQQEPTEGCWMRSERQGGSVLGRRVTADRRREVLGTVGTCEAPSYRLTGASGACWVVCS